MNWLRLSLKELVGSPKFVIFFVLNVMLGLSGFVLLENFKRTFQDHLNSRSKLLLGADASIGGRKKLPLSKQKLIERQLQSDKTLSMVDLFSMASTPETSRLVFLSEFRADFPFYGQLQTEKSGATPNLTLNENQILVYPELLISFETAVGKNLKIGQESFQIKDVITDDSSQTFQMGSIAPKIFMTREGIDRAGLIKKGSTAFYTTYFRTDLKIDEEFQESLLETIDDNALRLTTPRNSSEQVGRLVNYLTDFLGLVSLVALSLALIGIFYLYRSYLSERRVSFAILASLGMTRNEVIQSQATVLFGLSFLGTAGALLLSSLAMPFLEIALSYAIPFPLNLKSYWPSAITGGLVGIFGVLLTGLPMIFSTSRQPVSYLFQEGHEEIPAISTGQLATYFPLVLFFYGLSIWVSNSLKTGSIFFAVVLAILVVFFPILSFVLNRFRSGFRWPSLEWRLSMRYLTSYKVSTISIFLSIFFGSLFITFIPSLKAVLDRELDGGIHGPSPSLFLFDIQEEQVDPLEKFADERSLELLNISPMIRGRLLKINGQALKVEAQKALTREGQREQRFRNRGVNITYNDGLNDDETLIEGEMSKPYGGEGVPEISLEFRYASRMGIKVGDTVTFDIMDIEQEAYVTGLRRIRWTSFRPNFFIAFPKEVLDDAPKTFLAAIPNLPLKEKIQFQTDLVKAFPNVSAVDLDRLVAKIKDILGQMSFALSAMSLVVIFVGFVVIFALIQHQVSERKRDVVLLKVLGMSLPRIRKMILYEFLAITASASLLGAAVGLFISYWFSVIFFEGMWEWTATYPMMSAIGITITGTAIAYFAIRKTLAEKSATYL